jgi:hypothetical protein
MVWKLKDIFGDSLALSGARANALLPLDQEAEDKLDRLGKFLFKRVREAEGLPEEVNELFTTHDSPIAPILLSLLTGMGGGAAFALLNSVIAPLLSLLTYQVNKVVKPNRLDVNLIAQLWLRGFPSEETKDEWWDELKELGWSDKQIEAARELAYPLPSIADFIFFARRDIFDKEVVDFYGYDEHYPEEMEDTVAKAGISPERWRWHWRAHWRDIEWGIANLLLHRGEITEDEHKLILRTANYPPNILDKMLRTSWDLPNRIELRMMARYLDVDKSFLVNMLGKVGLAEEYRSHAADFMLVMGIRSDLATRYRNGWITAEQVKEEIEAKGLSTEIADKLYKWIVKNVQPERVEEHRKLTRAIIIKGLKKGLLTKRQAIDLLMRQQNYAREEAEFIVDVELEGMSSPETPLEFQRLVEEYRKSIGEEYKEIPEELLDIEKQLHRAKQKLREAKTQPQPPSNLGELEAEVVELTRRYEEYATLHNFEALEE